MELTVLGLREEREPLAQARFKRRTPRPSGTILFFFFCRGVDSHILTQEQIGHKPQDRLQC